MNIEELKFALETMPFLENELAYLSITGSSESTLRDRLGYFLANHNHNAMKDGWNMFYPKEVNLKGKLIDLAVVEGKGSIESRLIAIMEFKHYFLTQVLYGSEFRGRKENSGIKQGILKDIRTRLEILRALSKKAIRQYQVLFISHYLPDQGYELVPERDQIYTHAIAKYLHIEGKKKELGLVRKFEELHRSFSNDDNLGSAPVGIGLEIQREMEYVFGNQRDFTVDVHVGLLGGAKPHKYHYFVAKMYFVIIEIIPKDL